MWRNPTAIIHSECRELGIRVKMLKPSIRRTTTVVFDTKADMNLYKVTGTIEEMPGLIVFRIKKKRDGIVKVSS